MKINEYRLRKCIKALDVIFPEDMLFREGAIQVGITTIHIIFEEKISYRQTLEQLRFNSTMISLLKSNNLVIVADDILTINPLYL